MTKITRATAESTIIKLFLTKLRLSLVDPLSPARTNSNWIRSKVEVRKSIIPTGNTDLTRKKYLIKESDKPDFPQVVVGGFRETNEPATIKLDTNVYYRVPCELTIRVLDTDGDYTRIGDLIGQISGTLYTNYSKDYQVNGISDLKWQIIPTPNWETDAGEYNEKQVLLTFNARYDEWQL